MKTPEEIRDAIINKTPGFSVISDSWLNPRKLLDGDLIKAMSDLRGSRGMIGENHIIEEKEVGLIIEALRNVQYQGYIRHLFYAFCNSDSEVFPARMSIPGDTCHICGKPVYYWSEWLDLCKENPSIKEFESRNFLAYGASSTKSVLCLDCLIQLKAAKELLDKIDPGILDYKIHTPWALKA